MADPDKLSRVFNNLIKNAISYSKEKSDITINVNKKNDNVLIEVIKKGKQISEENINKILVNYKLLIKNRDAKTSPFPKLILANEQFIVYNQIRNNHRI